MKKFLFTLAALLMAGSAFADDYFYVEDFEVSKDLLAQTAAKNRRMTVPVKAHFDAYVNSWQVDFGSVDGTNMDPKPVDNTLPAGVTIYTGKAGAPMTISYMDDLGEDVTQQLGLGLAQNNTRFIGSVGVVGGYWYAPGMNPDEDDPVTYGSIKWDAGDYDAFFTVTFQFDQDFAGAEIWIRSAPASGKDDRGPVTNGLVTYHKLTISVEKDAEQAQTPTIDITGDYAKTITITGETGATLYYSFDNVTFNEYTAPIEVTEAGDYTVYAYAVGPDGKTQSTTAEKPFTVTVYVPEQATKPTIEVAGDYAKTITITGETGATLYYSFDNENWNLYTAPFEVTEAGNYTVYAYAVGPQDKTKSETAEKPFTVTVYVPGQAETPVITVANDNTTEVTVTITGEAGAKLYYEVTPANRAYAEYTEALVYKTPGTYKITAYAKGPADKTQSELAEATFTVKAPDQPTPAGSFSYESDWQNYVFTVAGDNAQLIIDGEPAESNTIERPAYGQDPITVSVQVKTDKGTGYTPTTTEAQEVTILPQLPEVSISAVPGKGHIDWIDGVGYDYQNAVDGHYYDVSFAVNANENDETPYQIHYVITGPNNTKWEGTYDGEPLHFTANGEYSIKAWVVYGEDEGKVATGSFEIDNNTGVNELVNGKTVAGVRYFNMAGQEMQEANGMTIVVTTYTDGTTSAVKVMK